MNVPPRLPGLNIPLLSKHSLFCPSCGKKINVAYLGKDGKAIDVVCPLCAGKIGMEFINKFIAMMKNKK